ncbi:MAG TPA: metalloregulator ArsR/SmtB family transcription factor [Devosiaceae bacterium]
MEDDQLDRVLRALADPTRRRIINTLKRRSGQSLFELCVASVAEGVGPLTRQAISRHLQVLQDAGIVTTRWKGRTKLHTLDEAPIHQAIGRVGVECTHGKGGK